VKLDILKNIIKKMTIFSFIFVILLSQAIANPDQSKRKVKFYNFDDLLINGEYKKPQVLYTDARQKVRFEKLLKLKKDFLPKLKNTAKDPALR
tara:strand:+ start:5077 stop:5355 length:279 start_codon:yes stop_codon:yes gene_type:complete